MSIRVVSSDSTVSGSESPAAGATASSRMKSALPAARSVNAATAASESATSPAAARASARASSAEGRKVEQSIPAQRWPRRPARDDDEPRLRPRLGELREHELGGIVEPVRVLDHDRGRHHQHPRQQLVEHVVQPVAPEHRVDLVDLRRGRHLGVEGQREQRQPVGEIGHRRLGEGGQLRAGRVRGLVRQDADEGTEEGAQRRERRRRGVRLAAGAQDLEADGAARRAPRRGATCRRPARRRSRPPGSGAAARR